eukprot:m.96867 g.96867  ORF g.96867 m.96867 type:complete len:244 (+) comp8975_c2_seq1:44-775(+)
MGRKKGRKVQRQAGDEEDSGTQYGRVVENAVAEEDLLKGDRIALEEESDDGGNDDFDEDDEEFEDVLALSNENMDDNEFDDDDDEEEGEEGVVNSNDAPLMDVNDSAVLGEVGERRTSLRKRATEDEIGALANVLLLDTQKTELGVINEDGDAEPDVLKKSQEITFEQKKRWQRSLKRVQSHRGRTNSVLDVDGHELRVEDLASLPEARREAILNLVISGEMTVQEALSDVVETKNRSNCLIQ